MSQKEPPPQPLLDAQKLLKLIQTDGLLSKTLKGFESRDPQQRMMSDIIQAFNKSHIALIEAGTGTGKSIAYLVPALIWAVKRQERTVISTHTIALQEQLVHKDIPRLIQALNIPIKAVLLKGMNNYICLRKLDENKSEASFFPSEDSHEIHQIEEWTRTVKNGSRSDLPFRVSANTWEKVGADSDACSYNSCPYFNQCYYFKVREQAEEAQILVVNHSLLMADLIKRNDNDIYDATAVIPLYKNVIIDEAHHLEDVATEFLADDLSKTEVLRLLNKLTSEKQGKAIGKLSLLKEQIHMLFKQSTPHELTPIVNQLSMDLPAYKRGIQEQSSHLFDLFGDFLDVINPSINETWGEKPIPEQKLRLLKEHFDHPHWKSALVPQAEKLITLLKTYLQELQNLELKLSLFQHDKFQEQTKSTRLDIRSLVLKLQEQKSCLLQFITPLTDPNHVRWIEEHHGNQSTNVKIFDAQLDISKMLVEILFSKFPTIVLCSATLTTNQSFEFMKKRLGLVPKLLEERILTENIYESPFNYPKQALLVIPNDIPDPSHPNFISVANEKILEAIQASQGQAFVLFTSYAMLEQSYAALKERLESARYPLFKQGEAQRHQLLRQFVETKRSVLFGTSSFWEGIDVAGDALRCVIMVKLPFKVPSEPIVAARTEFIQQNGGNPFIDYSVPNAIVKFKQGFGRLIRNRWDRGCIVCLDTRLINKPYGQLFLNSLPACQRFFGSGAEAKEKMIEFYKQTYYLVNKSPFSQK